MASFVLAHGSWSGGWSWRRVADRLRRAGHTVFTPSFTGMGDRAHLLSSTVTIETFVEDLIGVIASEELDEVVLVGHSFGGVPITGVADRIPERLARLVYLDAAVLDSGSHAFSIYPPDEAQARIRAAESATGGLAVPAPTEPLAPEWGLGQPGDPDHDWFLRRMCAHPLRSYTTALTLSPSATAWAMTCRAPTSAVPGRRCRPSSTLVGWCAPGRAGSGSTSRCRTAASRPTLMWSQTSCCGSPNRQRRPAGDTLRGHSTPTS